MKKTYEVELRRTSYIVVTVEADTQEEAEAKAYDEGAVKLDNYASWLGVAHSIACKPHE